MALSPLQSPEDRAVIVSTDDSVSPSTTYVLDFTSGSIGGIIDGRAALEQFIQKAIITARYRFLVYDDEYGCDVDELIGQDLPQELFETEISYAIKDALIHDERVRDVSDFAIRKEGDSVYVSFNVSTVEGLIRSEVTI